MRTSFGSLHRMRIYVLRHGITELNKKSKVNGQIDEPLAAEGIKEAKSVIVLIPEGISYIYTSSLLRAKQTAEILNSERHLPVSIQDELAEIHMGSLAGFSWEEMEDGLDLKKKHRAAQFDYRSYGGESVEDVTRRLIPFLKKINDRHGDSEALIITHGGIIRLLNVFEKGKVVYETEKHLTLLTFDLDKIIENSQKFA